MGGLFHAFGWFAVIAGDLHVGAEPMYYGGDVVEVAVAAVVAALGPPHCQAVWRAARRRENRRQAHRPIAASTTQATRRINQATNGMYPDRRAACT